VGVGVVRMRLKGLVFIGLSAVLVSCSSGVAPTGEAERTPRLPAPDGGPDASPSARAPAAVDWGECEQDEFNRLYREGQRQEALGNFDQAAVAFEAAHDTCPELPGPWRWLAVVYKAQRRYRDCTLAAEQYLRLPNIRFVREVQAIADECRSAETTESESSSAQPRDEP